MKTCSKCKETKPYDCFQKRNTQNGYRGVCRDCRSKANRTYYNPEKKRDWHLRTTYGISLNDFNNLVKSQGNKCANKKCNKPAEVVDHNHATGDIRGILCNGCNTAAGLAQDNPEVIKGLANYLQENGHYG